jgi:hypothetical protein
MPTIRDLRVNGDTLGVVSTPLVEPLLPPVGFSKSLERFGEHYDVSSSSHLYRFLIAICGESGAGSIKKELLVPKLLQRLESTFFTDLDRFYGNALAFPRLSREIYELDPYNQILTVDQWQEIRLKDAEYRARCLLWMRAIIEGPTPRGIQLVAEAALGVDCDVTERYHYIENAASDDPITITDLGETNSPSEFVIIPRIPDVTEEERRRIIRMIDKIRPTNTVPTITSGDYLRTQKAISNIASTTDRFNVLRYVIGRPDVSWPDVDLSVGYWIEAGVEKEAPTFAFMDRQEAVTYLTIDSAIATTEHIGPFNQEQAHLFAHLMHVPDNMIDFRAVDAYAKNVAPINLTVPFIGQSLLPRNNVVVNNYYPIGYFAQENVFNFVNPTGAAFWASLEQDAGAVDQLVFDFGRERPCNFIDFEISQKPIDIQIEYYDGASWIAVTPNTSLFPDQGLSVAYLPSLENPWHYIEYNFELVQTTQIRVTFTRRDDVFPLPNSLPFPWSIEVRNLRLMHVIPNTDAFVEDTGVDVLGNTYRTDVKLFDAGNVLDDDEFDDVPSYWQSQPNPSRLAVEALYFDLRTGYQVGTMAYLDNAQMAAELDTRSMTDMEHYYENGTIIDEIWINPITVGVDMHIYYSLDDTPSWDDKLWIPIPRSYVLKRGFHALPAPTFVKYVKLEFSNLAAAPYQPVEYPTVAPITFRRFPSWVQDYFANVYPDQPFDPTDTVIVDAVQIDPLELGFQKITDRMYTDYESIRSNRLTDQTSEIKTFIETTLASQGSQVVQSESEAQIEYRTPIMWQRDLIELLDNTRALTRKAQEAREGLIDTGFNAEQALPAYTPPLVSSGTNLERVRQEKTTPPIWFPRRCRHGYQMVSAPLSQKVAYYVAVADVEFFRRDYTIDYDEVSYLETLGDDSHVEVNEFVQEDWRFVVS